MFILITLKSERYLFLKSRNKKKICQNVLSILSKANRRRDVFRIVMPSLLYNEYFNS